MQAVLAFLSSELGMDAAGVAKTVKAFPEVLGCAVDSQLARNVQKLQSEWRLQVRSRGRGQPWVRGLRKWMAPQAPRRLAHTCCHVCVCVCPCVSTRRVMCC
jgi:hypothetical protein